MLHKRYMTAKLSCLISAAVLAAGLVCAVLSCDGIGASVNSNGSPYGGTSGNSGSGGMGGSGRTGAGSGGSGAGGRNFTAEDFLSHANAGNTEAILEVLSDSGGNQTVGTFMDVLPSADIGLPAGGSVTLSITGDGYNYYGLAQDAGDGIISFEAPCIAVGTTVTVTLEVKAADGSIAATGTATQRVAEGGCDFSIAMTDTAPAPAPEGFVPVGGGLYMCIHELTQGEYEAYCSYGGLRPEAAYGVGPDYPAYYVSWYDALVYCNKRSMAEGLAPCYTISGSTDPAVWGIVPSSSNDTWNAVTMDTSADGYRLPTEAEWLQAADDGHTYSGSNTAGDVAWYSGNSGDGGGSTNRKSHEVKTKNPNAKGIYDMSGNVWEWCWDADASSSNRVYHGGSWDYSASYCTIVSGRSDNSPRHRRKRGFTI